MVLFEDAVPVQATAKAFAKEPWNRQFFEDLRKAHQTHYEQIGLCRGEIHLEGDVYTLDAIPTFRDHSFGKHVKIRSVLTLMMNCQRHSGLEIDASLHFPHHSSVRWHQDASHGHLSAAYVHTVSQMPNSRLFFTSCKSRFPRLELGYVSTTSGRITYVDDSDLCLAHHGEGGRPQEDYAFTFSAGIQKSFFIHSIN